MEAIKFTSKLSTDSAYGGDLVSSSKIMHPHTAKVAKKVSLRPLLSRH
jgi:hypothetical protein